MPGAQGRDTLPYLFFAIAFALWSSFGVFVFLVFFRDGNVEQMGQFGDSFGVLNTLFSAFAAVAAYLAFQSQQRQLEEQQREFAFQRHESHLFFLMEELRNAVRDVTFEDLVLDEGGAAVNRHFSGQFAIRHIENIFLGMMHVSSDAILLIGDSPSLNRGREFIVKERFWIAAGRCGTETSAASDPVTKKPMPPAVIRALTGRDLRYRIDRTRLPGIFQQFFEECAGAYMGNVFRLQGAILRFIDNVATPEHERTQHAELFKAQITDPELHLLLYYALSDLAGGDDLRQIMVRYNILEALWRKKPEFIWHRIPEISYFETTASSLK
jgi:hypothetical protein